MSEIKLDLCKLFNVEEEEEFELTFNGTLSPCDKVLYGSNDRIYKVVNNTLLFTLKGQVYYTKSNLPCYLLTGGVSVKKVHLLTHEEKDYLESVIYPVRDKAYQVIKWKSPFESKEYIRIILNDGDAIYLYSFEIGTQFKGMIADKEYTLKELGLFQD